MKRSMLFEAVVAIFLIMLVFILYVMIADEGQGSGWQVPVNGAISSMYAGDDDTLYAFAGNTIYAISKNGNLNWQLSIPDNWTLCSRWASPIYNMVDVSQYGFDTRASPVIASKNGILYAYLRANQTILDNASGYTSGLSYAEELIAISPEGKIAWKLQMAGAMNRIQGWGADNDAWLDSPNIQVDDSQVYLFHDNKLNVVNVNGTFTWGVTRVSDPPAIDDAGNVYLLHAEMKDSDFYAANYGYMSASNWMEAFYLNGTEYWTRTLDGNISEYSETGVAYGTLPIYHSGMLYVPLDDGVEALDTSGNMLWSRHYNASDFQFKPYCDGKGIIHQTTGEFKLFEQMPFDIEGNVYLECFDPINGDAYLCVIDPDGKDVSPVTKLEDSNTESFLRLGGAVNGRAYYIYSPWGGVILGGPYARNVDSVTPLNVDTILARDAKTGKDLWKYTPLVNSAATITLNASNVRDLLSPSDADDAMENDSQNVTTYQPGVLYYENTRMATGNDVIYVNTESYNFDYPVVFNESKVTYVNIIYALDANGTLIWQKPVGSYVTTMQAANGTFYYSTSDGKINAAVIDAAAGIALLAIAYVVLRFIFIGSVARAKSRIDKNENRNVVYDYIVKNPGSTMYDIARSLDMNIGTVRYHLFILRMNHRIVEHHSDVKYVRYFTNSGSYSKEEQAAVSLVKREGMRRILELLIEKPGLSNMQIAQALNIPESSVSRYMKELSDKSVVTKELISGGSYAYSIQDAQKERIASSMEHLKSE